MPITGANFELPRAMVNGGFCVLAVSSQCQDQYDLLSAASCRLRRLSVTITKTCLTKHVPKVLERRPDRFRRHRCGYLTDAAGLLEEHGRDIHTKIHDYQSTLVGCSFKTFRKFSMSLHMRTTHTKRKVFCCDSCRFRTLKEVNLNRHKQCHELAGSALLCDK